MTEQLLAPRPSPRAFMTELLAMTQGKYKPSETLPAAAGLPGRHPPGVPLVPIFVGTDRDGEVIREQFLWRLGETGADPAMAAQRLSRELRLPPILDKTIEDSINVGVKPFRNPIMELREGNAEGKGALREFLIEIQIDVAADGVSFIDRVLWDLLEPVNSPEGYALTVCRDLKLGTSMYEAIRKTVAQRLDKELAEVQERRRKGEPVQGLEPPAKRVREGTGEELLRWTPIVRDLKVEDEGEEEEKAGAAACNSEGSPGPEFPGAAKDEDVEEDVDLGEAVSEVKSERDVAGTPGETSRITAEDADEAEGRKPLPTKSVAEEEEDDDYDDQEEEDEEEEDGGEEEDNVDGGEEEEDDNDALDAELQLAMEEAGAEPSGAASEEEEEGEEEEDQGEEAKDAEEGEEGEEGDGEEEEEGEEGEDAQEEGDEDNDGDGMDLDGIDFSAFGDDDA